MFMWQQSNQTPRASVVAAAFTPEEVARLRELREEYEAYQACREFGLDPRRLHFARWLVQQGRLNEGIEGTHLSTPTQR